METTRSRAGTRSAPRRGPALVFRVVVALATVVFAAGVSGSTAAAATGEPLVSADSGKCLDVAGNNPAPGTEVIIWDCHGGANQSWHFTPAGELRVLDDSRCLDAYNFGTSPGTRLIIWECHGGANQQFRLNADGTIVGVQSGLCVDVTDFADANGTPVMLWTCHGGANQRWSTDTGPPSYPNPGYVTGDIGVHDPTVARTPDGGYLVAHTGWDIALKTSADRITFRSAGVAFPGGAPWTFPYTDGGRNLWAPDISYRNGRYYLYYSASTFGSNHSAIFLATSPTGESGTWTNHGLVVESSTSDNFNAIDPNLIVDDQGRWWLSFGSFWSGIKLVQLDPATGKRANTTMHSIAGRGGGAIEAPHIFKSGQYYYLYVSFDLCCRGASSTYRVMVGRSTTITGPYVDRAGTPMTAGGGTEILAGHGSVNGPGHQAVFADADSDVLVYHYYADNGRALLGINLIDYDSADWPYVY